MDDEDLAELAHLRRRAYGAEADIHGDPAALERLRILENSTDRRVIASPPSPDEPPAQPGSPAARAAEVRPDELAAPGSSSRRISRAITLGLVIVAAAVSAFVAVLIAGIDPSINARLQVDPDLSWPETSATEWITGSEMRYDDFLGLAVMSGNYELDPGYTCLLVDASPFEMRGGRQGCAQSGLTPILDVIVGPRSPDELKHRFAQNTVLRFTLEGGTVTVRAGEAQNFDGP